MCPYQYFFNKILERCISIKAYKNTFRLNASHSISNDKGVPQTHHHTFTLSLDIVKTIDDFEEFEQIENGINEYLNRFRGKYINSIDPFTHILPTIENMGRYFYDELSSDLDKNGYKLIRLEIGETPAEVFSVSDFVFAGPHIYDGSHPVVKYLNEFTGKRYC